MFLLNRIVFLDAPEPWGMNFQDPATPLAQGIQDLHHDIFFFLTIIMIFVLWMLGRTLWFFSETKNPRPSRVVHGQALEIIWTVVPSVILLILAVPSFALLYSMDEVVHPGLTLKVTGNQWYWNYEYSDYTSSDDDSIIFDSYMIPEEDLEEGQLRLLEVDNRVVLPVQTHIRVLITARDVIHSWSVPSLAIKCDGIPGRLNQISIFIEREGLFYGQCSEICGLNHGFMPIVVESVSLDEYLAWIDHNMDAPAEAVVEPAIEPAIETVNETVVDIEESTPVVEPAVETLTQTVTQTPVNA
jgi:cytochrome c oxidase subunit 2